MMIWIGLAIGFFLGLATMIGLLYLTPSAKAQKDHDAMNLKILGHWEKNEQILLDKNNILTEMLIEMRKSK